MKKLFLTLGLVLVSVAYTNAQYFVGGSVDFYSETGNTNTVVIDSLTAGNPSTETDVPKDSYTSFTIMPQVGYFLNDKLAVGLGFSFGSVVTNENNDTTVTPSDIVKTTTWKIVPFVRYYFAEFGKFKLYAQADFGFGGTTSKTDTDFQGATTTVDNPSSSNIDIIITPSIEYNLSEKFSLSAELNFMEISYFSKTTKTINENPGFNSSVVKSTDNEFYLGLDTNNVTSPAWITIGASYKF